LIHPSIQPIAEQSLDDDLGIPLAHDLLRLLEELQPTLFPLRSGNRETVRTGQRLQGRDSGVDASRVGSEVSQVVMVACELEGD
jgi:hypothetical protein